ncbi:hypothetical protein [Vibrio harveyi]|uniref:hypothetical protein n=1 Tax=Vibrio harveyi TaxID=669 RepID=UPI00217DF664|nr:hypothetical protein [Vibrio harveyi]
MFKKFERPEFGTQDRPLNQIKAKDLLDSLDVDSLSRHGFDDQTLDLFETVLSDEYWMVLKMNFGPYFLVVGVSAWGNDSWNAEFSCVGDGISVDSIKFTSRTPSMELVIPAMVYVKGLEG